MSDYVPFPLETEPTDLLQEMVEFLQDRLPGWEPHEGNLEMLIMEGKAQQDAETRDLAADVPPAIFRAFGKIARLPAIEALQAWVTSTWTMIDTAGHTIPVGTIVTIDSAAGEPLAFETIEEIVVPNGSAVTAHGAVTLVAVEAGAAATGLDGPVTLSDPLDFVQSIALENTAGNPAVTVDGIDAESDDAYVSRLSRLLTLLAPRPILPPDFAILLQERIPGVDRAMAIDGYELATILVNEIQRIRIDASGGTYRLTFNGQQTANIAYDANAATIQAALVALSNIAPGDVVCTDDPEGARPAHPGPPPIPTFRTLVEFRGAYLYVNVPEITVDGTNLTGVPHGTVVETVQDGGGHSTGDGGTIILAAIDAGGQPVPPATKQAGREMLEAEREANFLVLIVDPTYSEIDVAFTGVADEGYDPADVQARGIVAVTDYLSPANWGQPDVGDSRAWNREHVLYYNEVLEALNDVDGLKRVNTLEVSRPPDSPIDPGGSIALPGDAPLTQPGDITGLVTAE